MFIEAKKAVSSLMSNLGVGNQRAQVKLGIDRSVSIKKLYDNGTMQRTIERCLALGMVLDDDKKIDVYTFEDITTRITTPATEQNYSGFVERYIQTLDYGGTQYAPMIQAILRDSGASQTKQITYMKAGKKGLASLFGGSKPHEQKEYIHVNPSGYNATPTLAIIITDGDAEDKYNAERLLIEAAKYPVFFAFVGVKGDPTPSFKFLKELDTMKDRFIDNASFKEITPDDLVTKSDEQFYKMILGEFGESWLPAAKNQFLIK